MGFQGFPNSKNGSSIIFKVLNGLLARMHFAKEVVVVVVVLLLLLGFDWRWFPLWDLCLEKMLLQLHWEEKWWWRKLYQWYNSNGHLVETIWIIKLPPPTPTYYKVPEAKCRLQRAMPLETERVMCWHVVPCDVVTWWWMMALKVDGSIDWLIGVLVLWPDLGCWLSGRGLMGGSACVWFCERKLVNWQISGETLTHGFFFAHSPSQKKSRSCDLLNIFTGDNTQASTSVLNIETKYRYILWW